MSITCVEVKDSELVRKAALYGAKEFVRVNVDQTIRNEFPFPSSYEFTPCFLPKKYKKLADRIRNFKVRPDDVWTVTFPKVNSFTLLFCLFIIVSIKNISLKTITFSTFNL